MEKPEDQLLTDAHHDWESLRTENKLLRADYVKMKCQLDAEGEQFAKDQAEIIKLRAEIEADKVLLRAAHKDCEQLRAELSKANRLYENALADSAIHEKQRDIAEAKLERVREIAKGALHYKLGGDLSAFTYHEALKSIAATAPQSNDEGSHKGG